jgi:purine-binding chemotaxis protein CheW
MTQLLPFLLGAESYALDLVEVQEVVENPALHALPGAPEVIAGAISFHGRIVPVIDLSLLLGFAAGERAARVIVLIDAHGPVALRVGQLQRIISIDPTQGPLSQSASVEDCISGVLNRDGEIISLLDLQQLHLVLEQLCTESGG